MFKSNATLSYKVTSTESVINDPITGEPIFSTIISSESITVSLEQKNTQSSVHDLAGKDITGTYCEGRLVSPQQLPSWYCGGTELTITWDNGKPGRFYVLPTVSSRLGLESCFGQPIKGVLLT